MNLEQLKTLKLQQLKDVKELNLNQKKLTTEDISFLATIASSLTSLEIINCQGVKLDNKKFSHLISIFALCPAVTYINLAHNQLKEESIKTLIRVLPTFKNLISLDLSNNKIKAISDDLMDELVTMIKEKPSLVHLHFGPIPMRNKGSEITQSLKDNHDLGAKLLEAVNQDDIKSVRKLVKKGANINVLTYLAADLSFTLRSPIHIAATKANPLMLKYLLEKGARPTIVDAMGRTPGDLIFLELEKLKNGDSKVPLLKESLDLLNKKPSKKDMLKRHSLSTLPRKKGSMIASSSSLFVAEPSSKPNNPTPPDSPSETKHSY